MDKKNIIKIINEELNNYDFLHIEENNSNDTEILNSKDFQVTLIHELGSTKKSPMIRNWKIMSKSFEEDNIIEDQTINIEYDADFVFNYNGVDYNLTIIISGDDIPVELSGESRAQTWNNPPEAPQLSKVFYDNVNVGLFTSDGDKIDISWLERDKKTKNAFLTNLLSTEIMI